MTEHFNPNSPLAIALRTRDLLQNPSNWTKYSRINSQGRSCLTGLIFRAMGVPIDSAGECFQASDADFNKMNEVCQVFGFPHYHNAERFNDSKDHEGLLAWIDAKLTDYRLREAEQEALFQRMIEEELV